ncbi:hypothetical protein EAE96_007880 [Botrytis aclada]|nr:hypothetical protein EAE96_007880 [Botrytis aclada]
MSFSTTTKMASFKEKESNTYFRTFPIELRNMIYYLLLQGTWEEEETQSRQTAQRFLAALRADVGLYKEALLVFYKTNTFCLNYQNHWLGRYFVQSGGVRFMDTRVVSLASTLRNVHVEVPVSSSTSGPVNRLPSTTPTFDRTARIIRMAQNLTYLHVEPTVNKGCRTQWLALICDLIGPVDSCPALLTLKFTWAAYMIDKHSHSVEWTIQQFDIVFGTQGYLESPSTGHKASWIWQHRDKDSGRVLTWGNGGKSPARIEVSLGEVAAMRQRDSRLYKAGHLWVFRDGRSFMNGMRAKSYVSILSMPRRGAGANGPPLESFSNSSRGAFRRGRAPPLPVWFEERDAEVSSGMWRHVSSNSLHDMKKRCEKEWERGSLIHGREAREEHEKEKDNHLTKWLYDQDFECPVDTVAKYNATLMWARKQELLGNPSQRGSEGDLLFIQKPEDVDVDSDFRSHFADGIAISRCEGEEEETHPTIERRVPGVKYDRKRGKKYHSALPSNWDGADSDAEMEVGEGVWGEEGEGNDGLVGDGDGVDVDVDVDGNAYAESGGSGGTVLLEDLVFEPGRGRWEIIR